VTALFLSYGGSSILSLMFLVGIVFNVAWRNFKAVNQEFQNLRCYPRQ
jgi:cell division protein FtsW (lipid II flippase)